MKHIIRSVFKKHAKLFSLLLLSFVTLMAFIPVFTYAYFAADLTDKDAIMNRKDTGILLLDRHGKPFFTFYQAKSKDVVPLSEISVAMQHAVIASEDEDFYAHPGFSIRGIVRSLYLDVTKKDLAYGGSTITQQLVKNALLSSEKSVLRKYQEIVLAQEIERRFSKNEILEMYLNSVYFGEGAFGVEDAAQRYYGKHAKDLTVSEASMLVGVLPSPSAYSPISGNGDAAKTRQQYVLTKMVEKKYITAAEKAVIEKEKITFHPQKEDINSSAAHFALMVRDELIKRYGEEYVSRSGFRVQTTLDFAWQQYAEEVVQQQVARLAGDQVTNGAAVVIDPKTGEVRVLVGSKDWYDTSFGKVNIATSLRQPGSSFKPFVYAAALEDRDITPATILQDKETTFQGNYKPHNYDNKFRGPVLVRRALSNSLNVPAVAVMEKVGVPKAIETAQSFGLTTIQDPSQYGLSLVLGAGEVKLLELTNAYATFANAGVKNDIIMITSIEDKHGKNIYRAEPHTEEVISPETAFLISSMLSDNNARAEEFGNALTISRPAAVKTGTTENYRDALTMGYTPSITVGVWVGNNDGKPMDRIAGSLGAAPIWKSLMERFLSGTPVEQFALPAGITKRTICRDTGLWAKNATSSAMMEYFLSGTEPTQPCYIPPVVPTVRGPQPSISSTPSTTVSPTPQGPGQSGDNKENKKRKEEQTIQIQISPSI